MDGPPVWIVTVMPCALAQRTIGVSVFGSKRFLQNRPTFVCNCCGCCCGQLEGVSKYGLAAVNPSGFTPSNEPSTCVGCSRCARACPVGAPDRAVAYDGLTPASLADRADFTRVHAVITEVIVGDGSILEANEAILFHNFRIEIDLYLGVFGYQLKRAGEIFNEDALIPGTVIQAAKRAGVERRRWG